MNEFGNIYGIFFPKNITHCCVNVKTREGIKYLLQGSTIFYLPSNYHYFIIQFLQSGFQLYVKEKER